MRSNGKPNTDRFAVGRDLSADMKSVRSKASPVRKAVDASVRARILACLFGASNPAGSSTLRTRSRVSRRFSLFPDEENANAAAYDANN
jgi:hypothetical protein